MATNLAILDIFGRMLLALVLGAVIGWEREKRDKPAGLRTHIMVTVGSAAFVLVALEVVGQLSTRSDVGRLDPTRVIEGVVGGIGFLGAGSIIQARGKVSGVTTAASVWVAGAIGVACGSGSYVIALFCAGMAWLTLAGLGLLEHRLLGKEAEVLRPSGSADGSGAG